MPDPIQLEVGAEWIYLVLSAVIKISVLLLYRRIFTPSKIMTRTINTAMVIIGALYLIALVISILNCQPIEKRFNPLVEGLCLPLGTTAYSSGAINVLTDVFVVFLPMPTIWGLNMKMTKKLRI